MWIENTIVNPNHEVVSKCNRFFKHNSVLNEYSICFCPAQITIKFYVFLNNSYFYTSNELSIINVSWNF